MMQPYDNPAASPAYWKEAAAQWKDLRMLVLAALMMALRITVAAFFIPVGDNLRVYASFFVAGLAGATLGPLLNTAVGFGADILGFFLFPSGAFFPGYTLSSMLGSFFYGLFFFRQPVTLWRAVACKGAVNILVNIGLGSLWSQILYGKGMWYYLLKSAPKNLILWPIEAGLLYLFLKAMVPVAQKMGFIPPWATKPKKEALTQTEEKAAAAPAEQKSESSEHK